MPITGHDSLSNRGLYRLFGSPAVVSWSTTRGFASPGFPRFAVLVADFASLRARFERIHAF